MKTFFAIVLLIVFGIASNFISVLLVNIAGLPGALLAGRPGARSKARFVFGSLVSAVGQSYIYLAYTAFIVNWTLLAAKRPEIVGWLLWPFAFLAVWIPIIAALSHAKSEAQEQESANPQVEALHITVVVTLIAFFIFAFLPVVMSTAWSWVPYIE